MRGQVKDLSNQRFGRLVAYWPSARGSRGATYWLCLCDCGNLSVVRGNRLGGTTRSCGCIRRELCSIASLRHGGSGTVEYHAYHSALKHCRDENHPRYKDWGGRGIQFLFESFEQFFLELGPKPSAIYSLDRIDNDGNYESGNVRWATPKQQMNNQRK